MPASFDSLDMQLNMWRDGYKRSIQYENWELASHFVELMNSSVPPPARITDLPNFVPKSTSYRNDIGCNDQAKEYCVYWMAKVELSLSINRDKIVTYYKAENG
jgi:hypothetical protein